MPLSRTRDVPFIIGRQRVSGSNPGYVAVVGITPEPTSVNVVVSAPIAADSLGRFPATSRGGTVTFEVRRGEVVHLVAAEPPECDNTRPGWEQEFLCAPGTPDCNAWLEFCLEAEYDLTGSRITSNHPIEVFGGHVCAYVPHSGQACDHLENQMPPLETWGQEYVSGPLGDPSSLQFNVVRITAAFDGTNITIDPPQDGVSSLTLNTGQWEQLNVDSPFRVSATNGIMVTQYLIGQHATEPAAPRGDPAMIVLPPSEQFRSDYTFVAPSSYNESVEGQSYLLLVRPAGLAITLDGRNVETTWTTVGENEVGIVPISGGTHQMDAEEQFGVLVYGMGQNTSYAYPAGLNLEEILLI